MNFKNPLQIYFMRKKITLVVMALVFGYGAIWAQTKDMQNDSGRKNLNLHRVTKNAIKGFSTCFAPPAPAEQVLNSCNSVNIDVPISYAKLIYTDISDETYVNNASFTYGPPMTDTAFNAHVYPGSDVLISEIGLGDPDIVEIQNVSNSTIHTEGWFVVVSNDYNNINSMNSTLWMLPDSIAPGEILFKDDNSTSAQYWGSNLFFNENSGNTMWAMIIDNCGNIIDAVFYGWSKADINTMSITANGHIIVPRSEWLGNGIDNSTTTYSILRKGNTDNQMVTDFDTFSATGSENPGTQYTGLDYPFTDITEIEVPLANTNGEIGIMFNVVAKEDIQIESFTPYLSAAVGDEIRVYYLNGSYLNDMNSLTNWTYAGAYTFTTAYSNAMAHVPVGNIFIPKGDTLGLYLECDGGIKYSNGNVITSDDFIDVIYGHGISSVGGTTYSPRYYVGKIHYSIGRNLDNNTAKINILNTPVNVFNEGVTDNNCQGQALGSVDSLNIVETSILDEGAFSFDYYSSSHTRGYAFIAPVGMKIEYLKVPDMNVADSVQNIQVVKFDNDITGPYTTLYYGNNLPADQWINVNLDFQQGDVIGILGARGTSVMHNAYGPAAPFSTVIAGDTTNLYRIAYQDNLNTTEATTVFSTTSSDFAQIYMKYSFSANPNFTYTWDNGATTLLIDNLTSGTYNLTVTNGTCTDSLSVNINDLHPAPVINLGIDTTLCANESMTLDAGTGYVSYLWSTGETTNSALLDTSALGIGSFAVWAQVEDINGCYGYDTVMVTFEICSGAESLNANAVNLYPNPNNGEFNIDLSKLNGETNITITNVSGQIVKEIKSEQSSTIKNVSLNGFEKGMYFIKIENKTYNNLIKMIIQ